MSCLQGNEPPRIDNSSLVLFLNVNTTITVVVNASDPDGDDITFNVTGLPDNANYSTSATSISISWKVTQNKVQIHIYDPCISKFTLKKCSTSSWTCKP